MATRQARFRTKELSTRTWPDYVRFFSQGNGWDHCGCTAYQGFRPPRDVRKWADKRDWNLEVKCDLVARGRAHGVLVYAGDEPVGWCQFGPANELPIRDNRRRRRLFEEGEERKWRITCFCTDPRFSQQGVAAVALRAAIAAIRRRGGGLVEAHPVAHWNPDPDAEEHRRALSRWYHKFHRLRRQEAADDGNLRRHIETAPPGVEVIETPDGLELQGVTLFDLRGGIQALVPGVGVVNATAFGRFHGGTVAMFEREGFTATSVLPVSARIREPGPHPTRVVMQRVT